MYLLGVGEVKRLNFSRKLIFLVFGDVSWASTFPIPDEEVSFGEEVFNAFTVAAETKGLDSSSSGLLEKSESKLLVIMASSSLKIFISFSSNSKLTWISLKSKVESILAFSSFSLVQSIAELELELELKLRASK